jgi:hypothetical protein
MLSTLTSVGSSDAAGNALASAFAAIEGALLWLVLGILLLIGGVQGRMPPSGAIGALLLLPLSAVAAVTASEIYTDDHGWTILVPVVLPPLFAGYAVWARLPALHQVLRPLPTGALVGLAVAALSIVPLVQSHQAARPNPAREAALRAQDATREAKEQQEQAAWRAQEDARFAALSPDSPLQDWLYFAEGSDDRAHQAWEGARHAKGRQADATTMLREGKLGRLGDLQDLNLAPTPELCAAYADALSREAAKVDRKRTDYLSVAIDLEGQLTNMRFLLAAHCDLTPVITDLRTRVIAVSDSPRIDQFAATLGTLKAAP